MAMIDPPIEVIIDKAENQYRLVSLISKRAKELLLIRPEFFAENLRVKPIEYASREYFEGNIVEGKGSAKK